MILRSASRTEVIVALTPRSCQARDHRRRDGDCALMAFSDFTISYQCRDSREMPMEVESPWRFRPTMFPWPVKSTINRPGLQGPLARQARSFRRRTFYLSNKRHSSGRVKATILWQSCIDAKCPSLAAGCEICRDLGTTWTRRQP